MIRRSLVVMLVACTLARAEDGVPSQLPLPRSAPLAPVQMDDTPADQGDRILRDLDRATRDRDERIQAILRMSEGIRPGAVADLGRGFERPRAERDKALVDLRAALDDWLGRTHRSDKDVLDPATATRQAAQVTPLSAENQIAIAECLRDLALEEIPELRENRLAEGLKEISALPPEIPEYLRPRAAWLNVFFLAELARLPGDTAQRADLAARARAAAEVFPAAYPSSELTPAVTALVADLPKGGAP
jgi:hypothetical protein